MIVHNLRLGKQSDSHSQGFGIVNKAEIDCFLELSCFFHSMILIIFSIMFSVLDDFTIPIYNSSNILYSHFFISSSVCIL